MEASLDLNKVWDNKTAEIRKTLQSGKGFSYAEEEQNVFVCRGQERDQSKKKDFDLVCAGLIHGNEWAGLEIIEALAKFYVLFPGRSSLNVVFILGNPQAFLQDKRYLEADLNRSFGLSPRANGSLEEKRAAELEPFLREAAFFIDYHQTITGSHQPFFIFPYQQQSLELASSIGGQIPIVTHWDGGYASEGVCSDAFCHQAGGVGLTLELGQCGFSPYYTGVGVQVAAQALLCLAAGKAFEFCEKTELYTIVHKHDFSDGGVSLKDGYLSFSPVKKGEVLGHMDQQPHPAPRDGVMLFPTYAQSGQPQPKAIYRIAAPISRQDLPEV